MPQHIDLITFTEDELIDLNRRVVERIKYLHRSRSLEQIGRFSLGETVSFEPDPGRVLTGTITRLNQKTITVATADGHPWRVSPALLSKTTDAATGTTEGQGVLSHAAHADGKQRRRRR